MIGWEKIFEKRERGYKNMDEAKTMRSILQKKWKREEDAGGERLATIRLPMNIYLRLLAHAGDQKKTLSETLERVITSYLDGQQP